MEIRPDQQKVGRRRRAALIATLLLLVGAVGGSGWYLGSKKADTQIAQKVVQSSEQAVGSFDECMKQANANVLANSTPRQCTVAGKTYTETIDPNAQKATNSGQQGASSGSGLDESVSGLHPEQACSKLYATEQTSSTPATVFYGDFNGDAVQDAVVGITLDGTGKYGKVCAYTTKQGVLSLTFQMPDADVLSFGKPEAYQSDSFKYRGASSYMGIDTVVDTTRVYKWSGTTFVKQ